MASVLLIEGLGCSGSQWYSESLLGNGMYMSDEEKEAMASVWAQCAGGVERADFAFGEGAAAVQERLRSGQFKVVIVCDLSAREMFPSFESRLGPLVEAFAKRGGWVLFPTSDGLALMSTLRSLFQTPWRESAYYRTTWGVPPENAAKAAALFGSLSGGTTALSSYSCKACSIRSAGADAVMGVTPDSRHESLAEILNGTPRGDAALRQDATSATAGLPSGGLLEEDYDVCCACRDVGDGKIAYFGDVNAEYQTCLMVASLCRRGTEDGGVPRAVSVADVTVADRHALSPDEFAAVLDLKTRGNDAFKADNFHEALEAYAAAADLYGDRLGAVVDVPDDDDDATTTTATSAAAGEPTTTGPPERNHGAEWEEERNRRSDRRQRDTKVTLFSNSAECYLRLHDDAKAEEAASKALELDEACVKARVRRVKAIVRRLEKDTNQSDLDEDVEFALMEIEQANFDLSREKPPRLPPPEVDALQKRLQALLQNRRSPWL